MKKKIFQYMEVFTVPGLIFLGLYLFIFPYFEINELNLDPLIEWFNHLPYLPYLNFSFQIAHFDAVVSSISALIAGVWMFRLAKNANCTCILGRLKWDRNAFCQGWLVTGGTGSGKTQCAINILMHQVFQREVGEKNTLGEYIQYPWGGLCIDEKGLYWQTLEGMAQHYGRQEDLILLQTKPDYEDDRWVPEFRLNLLADDSIPPNTYASAIVKTAAAIDGGANDKGFFKTQTESNIGWAIELLRSVRDFQLFNKSPASKWAFPSLKNVLEILTNYESFDDLIRPLKGYSLENSKKLKDALNHFRQRYWNQPKDQLGGVQSTIYNYLNYFANDEIAEVFCKDCTFNFDAIEQGKILCVSMPQKLQTERRYVCTLLKMLFYTQVLRRFDMEKEAFKRKNLLLCWQDEAQRFITEADGNVDVIREAGATTIMACQSKISLHPPLGGKEKANVTILNLRNRMIFKAADQDCAEDSSEFLGKRSVKKKGKGNNADSKTEDFLIKPHEFRMLDNFCAVVCHASGKYKKYLIAPKDPDGKTPYWWYKKIPLIKRIIIEACPWKINFLKF